MADDAQRAEADPAAMFGMTDLEEALQGPDGAAIRAGVIARLDALATNLQQQMDRGIEPNRFETARRILGAVATARRVMVDPSR
jgi:hypothetical protein